MQNKRGGHREGAGRKKLPITQKKRRKTYTLSPDVVDFLSASGNATKTIETAVRIYIKKIDAQHKRRINCRIF